LSTGAAWILLGILAVAAVVGAARGRARRRRRRRLDPARGALIQLEGPLARVD